MSTRNEVAMKRQPNQTQNRPAKTNNYATKKSTYQAKIETLRRKTIRSEKYGSAK